MTARAHSSIASPAIAEPISARARQPTTSQAGGQTADRAEDWAPLNAPAARSSGFAGAGCTLSAYEPLARCWACFENLPLPGRDDWLHKSNVVGLRDRDGQTVRQFADPTKLTKWAPSTSRSVVYLCPMGRIDGCPDLSDLAEVLQAMYSLPVRPLQGCVTEAEMASVERNPGIRNKGCGYGPQIETPSARSLLLRHKPSDAFCIVGYTMEDLCHTAKGYAFLYGQACSGEGCGIFSFARYCDGKESAATVFRRCAMILAHEVGHLWRIKHCVYAKCV